MLFLRAGEDFVPYTPRDKQNLRENLQGLGPGIQAESLELAIRKEVRVSGSEEAVPPGRPQAAELGRWPPAQLCCPPTFSLAWASSCLQGQLTGSQRKGWLFPALFAWAPFPPCTPPPHSAPSFSRGVPTLRFSPL